MLIGEYAANLKPCPFCGGRPRDWENTVCYATIRCACGIVLSIRKERETDEVYERDLIDKWNWRAAGEVTDRA